MLRAWLEARRLRRSEKEKERGFQWACSSVLRDNLPLYYVDSCARHSFEFDDFDRGALEATERLSELLGVSVDTDDYDL